MARNETIRSAERAALTLLDGSARVAASLRHGAGTSRHVEAREAEAADTLAAKSPLR